MSQVFEIWEKGLKIIFGAERSKFCCLVMREKGREKKKKNPNFSLRSTEFRRSEFIGPITKVNILDEGYAWVPNPRDFTEESSKEFGESKVSGLGSVHGSS